MGVLSLGYDFCMTIRDFVWAIFFIPIDIFAFFYDKRFSLTTVVEAYTFYNDWRVNHFDEEVKIV